MPLATFTSELSGYYRCVVSKDPGGKQVTKDTGWFKNLITDNGLNRFGGNITDIQNFLGFFHVGAGNATPAVSDTSLGSLVASTARNFSSTSGSSFSTGYAHFRATVQFDEGAAAGNLAEIGVGPTSNNLISRALILDSSGNPTAITVLNNEYLRVYYELRWNIPQTDKLVTMDLTIDGAPVSHDLVIRAGLANEANVGTGWGFSLSKHATWGFYTHNGSLGSETSVPSGSFFGPYSVVTISPYVADSHERIWTINLGLSQGNLSGGISAFRAKIGLGAYQVSIDPPLAKDSTKSLMFELGWRWAREGEL